MRRFTINRPPSQLLKIPSLRGTTWLNRETVYEGKLLSMTARKVRLFAPDPADPRPHADLSYDWVTPAH